MSTHPPCLPGFFDQGPRIADTSLAAWERILPTLQAREIAVALALTDYLAQTGRADVTGGELTEWMVKNGRARDVNSVRPRLTSLCDRGWLQKGAPRRCMAYGTSAHPVTLAVPAAAIARLRGAGGV